jgi:hypothetical protein
MKTSFLKTFGVAERILTTIAPGRKAEKKGGRAALERNYYRNK